MKPCLNIGVFRELKDVHYFNQVGILLGAVTSKTLPPETLLAELQP